MTRSVAILAQATTEQCCASGMKRGAPRADADSATKKPRRPRGAVAAEKAEKAAKLAAEGAAMIANLKKATL